MGLLFTKPELIIIYMIISVIKREISMNEQVV